MCPRRRTRRSCSGNLWRVASRSALTCRPTPAGTPCYDNQLPNEAVILINEHIIARAQAVASVALLEWPGALIVTLTRILHPVLRSRPAAAAQQQFAGQQTASPVPLAQYSLGSSSRAGAPACRPAVTFASAPVSPTRHAPPSGLTRRSSAGCAARAA